MPHFHPVLVTGADGAIGRVVCTGLRERGHRVRGFDRRPCTACHESLVGDLTDPIAVAAAVTGCSAVIHLGATPDRADFATDLVPNNIVGSYHVLEAMVAHGVRRAAFASTLRVVAGCRTDLTVTAQDGFWPHDHYSLSKCCTEVMSEMYARRHGLEIVAARIGWFLRNPAESGRLQAHGQGGANPSYLSWDDCVRFFVAAVEASFTGFHACFVLSRNQDQTRYDTASATDLIGYRPQDSFPEGTPPEVTGLVAESAEQVERVETPDTPETPSRE
jgi:uronate dehydrogenase